MKAIDPNNLGERENYHFLTGVIIPRPVAFVTTVSKYSNVLNGAPFSYFNIISSNPPLISISVQRKKGEMKDTARNAIDIQEFVVHISDETYIEEINKTAKSLPPEESEVSITNLTPIDSLKINVPGIKEARVRLECRLERAIPLGGIDGEPTCDLLIGRIVQYHIQEDLYENGEINVNILKPVSRLAGNHYATLGKQFELKRPF